MIEDVVWKRLVDRLEKFQAVISFPPVGDWHSGNAYAIYGEDCKRYYLESLSANETAADMFKKLRSLAKVAGLAITYGATAWTLASKLNIPQEEAERVINGFFQVFSFFHNHLRLLLEQAKKDLLVRDLFGRIRYLPKLGLEGWDDQTKKIRSAMRRLDYNAPIQTTGATQLKSIMITQHRYMEKGKLNRHLGNLKVTYKPYTRIVLVKSLTPELEADMDRLPDGNTKVLLVDGARVPVKEYTRSVQMRMGIIRRHGLEIFW